jgi:hypothetical protein
LKKRRSSRSRKRRSWRTEIVASGLISEAAKKFLNELAPLERLMPPLDIGDVQSLLAGQESEAARLRRLRGY